MSSEIATGLRRAYPRVLARVLQRTKQLAEAEDAVQDAMERALSTWPTEGVPESMEGWLITVATNRYMDGLRRRQTQVRHASAIAQLAEASPWPIDTRMGWDDDLLRLLFTVLRNSPVKCLDGNAHAFGGSLALSGVHQIWQLRQFPGHAAQHVFIQWGRVGIAGAAGWQ